MTIRMIVNLLLLVSMRYNQIQMLISCMTPFIGPRCNDKFTRRYMLNYYVLNNRIAPICFKRSLSTNARNLSVIILLLDLKE